MSSTSNLDLIFMGTPDFAVPSLERLIREGYHVAAVVTQPDRPKGRKKTPVPPPVKEAAARYGIPVLQPEKIRSADAVEQIRSLNPDLIVTAAYGQIVPKKILDIPRHGCINVHASLLPKYRGGAPIHHAVMRGEKETGVTIMYMAEGLDTGDMISRVSIPIEETDTAGSLFDKLKIAGAELLVETLPDLIAGKIRPEPQNEDEATYAPNITRDDEKIRWNRTSREVYNQVRGLNPWPVAYTVWDGQRLKIWSCALPERHDRVPSSFADAAPGTVVNASEEGIDVRTGDGIVRITELQPAGKRKMSAAEWVRGTRCHRE